MDNSHNTNVIIKEAHNILVDILKLDHSFCADMRYNTENNFTGVRVYKGDKCLVHKDIVQKLLNANNFLKEFGYTIKFYDAYRPMSAQYTLWDICPDERFIANPAVGSIHSRGVAVDVTIVDKDGLEAEMPTEFDDFSEKAAITYEGGTETSRKNRELMAKAFTMQGFARDEFEWWHFELPNWREYPLIDVEFEQF